MLKVVRYLLLATLLLGGMAIAEPGSTLAVRCGSLIDGIADEPIPDQLVVIRKGRIERIAPADKKSPVDMPFLDLSHHTCLPGLIDTHVHLDMYPEDSDNYRVYLDRTPADSLAISLDNARITLEAGFTSIRHIGSYTGWVDRDAREIIEAGKARGPRIQVAGFYLTIPHGGGDMYIPGVDDKDVPDYYRMGVSQGVEEFRRKAEELVAGGAEVIKVIASGAVFGFGGNVVEAEMSEEEIRAAVEVAHAAGIKLSAHAHGAQSIKDAIRAGADSIEHASLADQEAIELAVRENVAFSMDVYNGTYTEEVGPQRGWPQEFLDKNEQTTEAQRLVFEKAYKAGVPLLYGTDAGVSPHGANGRQFEVMVQRGMAPMDAIRSATSVAAEHMTWEADVGALEAGRYGDLVAVRGDPLQDISILQKIEVVIKDGNIVKTKKD